MTTHQRHVTTIPTAPGQELSLGATPPTPQTTIESSPGKELRGIPALRWLAGEGATFTLPKGGTKGEGLGKDWTNTPRSLKEAIEHAQNGGNVGLLTGKHSGKIIVLDRDKDFPATVKFLGSLANTAKIVRSNAPDRGKLLYRIKGDTLPKTTAWKEDSSDKQPAMELLSDGRHAIVPPSIYNDGEYVLIDHRYGIKEIALNDLQEHVVVAVLNEFNFDGWGTKAKKEKPTGKGKKKSDFPQRVKGAWSIMEVFQHFGRADEVREEGQDTRIMGNGGLMINDGKWFCHSDGVGGDVIEAWAWCKHGTVTKGDKELFKTVIGEMAEAKGINRDDRGDSDGGGTNYSEKEKQADLLYKLAMERATFFTGRQDSQVYASVATDDHRECYRMRSNEFNDWLAYAYYNEHGTTVSNQATEDCKKLLSFEAKKTIADVFVRVGHHMGKVYIDLGSPEWDAIEIDEAGWRIVKEPPVYFRRSGHMLPLVLPIECPDPLILAKYLNIEPADWPLVAAWITAALHPRGPFPVLGLLSRAGSGKSTALRVLKRIIDPSSAELRSQPNDVRDLYIAASNSWLLAFDNVSHLSPEVADALCVISTGGGFTRKSNYTDDSEHVINVQRPIAINGIGDVVTRTDLMDRTVLIGTPTIPEEKRQEETEFWQSFEQERPKILGAFLYALSIGLANINEVKLEKKPRMADFAKLAVAAETAYTDGRYGFMDMYTANREDAASVILENAPLGDVLQRIATRTLWEPTPEELYQRLNAEAKEYEKSSKAWPGAPNKLKGPIERLAPALERQKVRVGYKRSNGKRFYELQHIGEDLDL